MKYITPLLWSFLAVIALVEFSTPLVLEAIAPNLIALSNAEMTISE